MSEVLKKPYKITLWEDRNKIIYDNEDNVQNEYLEEVCIATIGSDTMDSPIRTFNPILTEELNGSKTFTFTIYSRYWDDKDEVFKDNPFIKLLVNERKVKLKYNTEWYDFVIKQVQENSENYTYTYTCKDLFVNELGKTGYAVELDTELENNMGTITELAETILDGTDWQVDKANTDKLIQKNKESLFTYIVPQDITNATYYLSGESYNTIAAGQVILVFNSSQANHENPVQFLYKAGGSYSTVDEAIADFYKTDDYGFVKDCDNLSATLPANWWLEVYPINMFGEKMLRKQKTKFFPQIGEVCGEYINSGLTYYAYTELEYASVTEIQSMISNGCGFISTNGWIVPDGASGRVMLSSTSHQESQTTVYDCALNLQGTVYNTGFYDNRAALSPNGFTKGEKYVLMVKGSVAPGSGSYLKLIGAAGNDSINPFLSFDTSINSSSSVWTSDCTGYTIYLATCGQSISYSNLLKDYSDMQFYLDFSGDLNDCKVFKYRLDSEGKLIIPDLQSSADSIIKTRYNFFEESNIPNQSIWTKQDLEITESLLQTDADFNNYMPVMIDGCEKVTSITGSKSNRFNLIQSLCEAFECWAKFTIDHDEIGRTIYEYVAVSQDEFLVGKRYYQKLSGTSENYSDDNNFEIYTGTSYPQSDSLYKKVYHKKVCFKEYIGDNNLVGFRYGINLKSIQRNIVSDQIASKVIVQPNTNEFAPNGSCTIQQSILNPTGENALYNFQYFINHNLLDGKALSDDLYGMNGGLGFFSKIREYNDSLQPYIDQLTEISSTLYTLQSRQAVYDAMMTEAQRLLNETTQELNATGYDDSRTSVPDYVKTLRDRKKTYNGTITYYTDLKSRNESLLNAYSDKYNDVTELLKNIRKQKDQLNYDFENKYYRFIQEGTWNSNDYYDPELYYQAASMVLYTSSFPQVSYTINVLEISQIEGFELYKFKIADKTYIEDTEFFGYDRQGRPYKEEIVISQVKYNLDDPSQNTITVRNYKTQFQDLFQRMAATSQSLQYHEGEYQRAASAINDDGTINSALMQNTLEANALVIQNAKNQSVTWDETGITISNYLNANNIVRLTSSGIVLTKDGGANWTAGITGDGVNADVITAGRIDTDRIRIFNKAMQQTFEWNDKGINAYMTGGSYYDDQGDPQTLTDEINYGQFVRFDKYGLYGYKGGYPAWDPDAPDNPSNPSEGVRGVDKAIRDSIFSLTWKGLNINIPPNSQDEAVISVGAIGTNNHPKFQVTNNGDVYLDGNIYLTGNIEWGGNEPSSSKVLYARTALAKPHDKPAEGETDPDYKTYDNYDDTDASQVIKVEQVGTYGWQSLNTDPDSGYSGVYQSTNLGVLSSASRSIVKINFSGYSSFKVKIKTNGPNNSYIVASTIDANSYPTSSSGGEGSATTQGANYTEITYSSLDSNKHHIYIVFYKPAVSSTTNLRDDCGYYQLPTISTTGTRWHKTYDTIFDNFASYSYDGGKTWTEPMSVQIDSNSVYQALVNNSDNKLGLFYMSGGGLRLNASYINTGTLDASKITVTNLNASSITAGTIDAAKITVNGNSIITNVNNGASTANSKVSSGYLDLKGIEIKNGSTTTFKVDSTTGAITINGTITASTDSSISWSYITNKPNIPTLPSYIKSTYIDSTQIYSPTIISNKFILQSQNANSQTKDSAEFTLDYNATSASYATTIRSVNGGLRLLSGSGDVFIGANSSNGTSASGGKVQLASGGNVSITTNSTSSGKIELTAGDVYLLGGSNYKLRVSSSGVFIYIVDEWRQLGINANDEYLRAYYVS